LPQNRHQRTWLILERVRDRLDSLPIPPLTAVQLSHPAQSP
jgi:hypothetical protein